MPTPLTTDHFGSFRGSLRREGVIIQSLSYGQSASAGFYLLRPCKLAILYYIHRVREKRRHSIFASNFAKY